MGDTPGVANVSSEDVADAGFDSGEEVDGCAVVGIGGDRLMV
ncbi:hypothetical protein [Corynebacterium macginleyi]